MSDWIYAIILGLVEGLTEFIPVSSTGHLLLAKLALGLTDKSWDTFIVLIQLGAILAVVAIYFARLWNVMLRIPTDPSARRFVAAVLIAFLPSAVVGLALHDFIKEVLFANPAWICWSLLIGGFVLLALDRWAPPVKESDAMNLSLKTALGVGLFQCLSIMPGVSRSGATIFGSVMMGVEKRAAAEFSFFLALPTMVGAFALDLVESLDVLTAKDAPIIAIGFVVSFLSGLLVVRTMVDFIGRRGLSPFGWWRIVVGGGGLALIYLG